jgi:hypothetical protein
MAEMIVLALGAYLAIGVVFALWYAVHGIARFDAAAVGTGWGFRLLIVPGAAALWPFLLMRRGGAK